MSRKPNRSNSGLFAVQMAMVATIGGHLPKIHMTPVSTPEQYGNSKRRKKAKKGMRK